MFLFFFLLGLAVQKIHLKVSWLTCHPIISKDPNEYYFNSYLRLSDVTVLYHFLLQYGFNLQIINLRLIMPHQLVPILLFIVLMQQLHAQIPFQLDANFTGTSLTNTPQQIISNNILQSQFNMDASYFDCSLPKLYTYFQTQSQLLANTMTNIVVATSQDMQIALTTRYRILSPTLLQSTCAAPGCVIQITNNCQTAIHYLNYFDMLELTLSSNNYSITASYFVYCLDTYSPNTLEWGLIVESFLVTVLIAVVALYSKPWSLGGRAIEINIWLVLLFIALLIIGALVGVFSQNGIRICLYILSFVLGIVGIAVCCNELLFLFRIKFLNRKIFTISTFQFRLLQALSLCVGVGITVGWYFSDSNIILNDIVSICMCVGLIKILKFTSLKIAGLAFLVTILLELAVVIAIYIVQKQSYNNLFLNKYNFPVEIQFPTLNPTYNQKCSWLPITSVVFPGMLLSYLRRFDSSRNTRVYLVTATSLFFLGGIAWVFANIASPVTFPFGLISQPCMFGLVCVFAYQRRQIRVIWSGQFYDEQFANQKQMRMIMQMIDHNTTLSQRDRQSILDKKLIQELKIDTDQSSRISDQNVVRSKFLRS